MTLLFGSPSSGKTTLLLALAGKLDPNLKVIIRIKLFNIKILTFLPYFYLVDLSLIFLISSMERWLIMVMRWMNLYPSELLHMSVKMISILEKNDHQRNLSLLSQITRCWHAYGSCTWLLFCFLIVKSHTITRTKLDIWNKNMLYHADILTEVCRREKEANIVPDLGIDIYMKVWWKSFYN